MPKTQKLAGQSGFAEKATKTMPAKRRATVRRTDQEKGGRNQGAEKANFTLPPAGADSSARRKNTEMTGQTYTAEKATLAVPVATDEDHELGAEKAILMLSSSVAELMRLQRRRRFIIKSQSRIDRSTDAFLARCAGYVPPKEKLEPTDGEKKKAKELFNYVGGVRKSVEDWAKACEENSAKRAAPPALPTLPEWADVALIVSARESRLVWDRMRSNEEKRMEEIANTLPVAKWLKGVKGFGPKGLAVVVGEAGDLSAYPSKSHLWKRLGLAVIDGERQQKKTGAEAAAAHGYSPQRRAEMWAFAEKMFFHQTAADKDEDGRDPKKSGKPVAVMAHPTGPYGKLLYRRRAATEHREGWTPGHSFNDARRYAFKKFIAHLRAAWIAAQKSEA